MATLIEQNVDVEMVSNRVGVESVVVRGDKLVLSIDDFFVRSILDWMETWEDNVVLHDIEFDSHELIYRLD